jgi:acyl transferase domain-containing protein
MTSPPNTPDPTTTGSASADPRSPSAPGSPWILLDRTTAEQAAAVLDRLEQWLAGADPAATTDCAHTCSHGQADEFEVAAWVGTLAAHLRERIEEVDSWS